MTDNETLEMKLANYIAERRDGHAELRSLLGEELTVRLPDPLAAGRPTRPPPLKWVAYEPGVVDDALPWLMGLVVALAMMVGMMDIIVAMPCTP